MPAPHALAIAPPVLPPAAHPSTSVASDPPAPAQEPRPLHIANAPAALTTSRGAAPVAPGVHARYLWAQRVLDAPLGTLSRQNALLAVVRGQDAGDAQARAALVLSVLPWQRVAAAFGAVAVDPRAAELTLILMLQALFNTSEAQGRQLLPLVQAYGRELSLAQWVQAVVPPDRPRGALTVDALPAVAARLQAMRPLARMAEAEAEELLLRTVLPGWGSASRAALARQWRDDPDGWSLADAAVRVRELTDRGRRGIEDALRTLHDERRVQRPPPAPAGNIAHALVGLLQAFFGSSAAGFADGVRARTGLSPAAPARPVIQRPSALERVATSTTSRDGVRRNLEAMDNRLRDTYEGIAFYRELMKRDPRARCASGAEPGTVADPGVGLPGDLDSPGRLTDLGVPLDAPDTVLPAFLAGAAGGVLRRTGPAEHDLAFTTLRSDDGPPASTSKPETVPDGKADLTPEDVTRVREQVPGWITQAPLNDQQTLQEWLDYQVTAGALLDEEVASLQSLHAFTENRLAMGLKHVLPDHTVDPADIHVTLTERTYPPSDIPGGFFELPQFPQPKGGVEPIITETTMSLVDFALKNFGPAWTVPPELTFSADGLDKGGRRYLLGEGALIDLVRTLNAGVRYKEYLDEQLIAHNGVRDAWVASLHAGLQVALQTARMRGTVFPPDFYLDPMSGLDFVSRMLDAVFAQPVAADRPHVDAHLVEITTLKIGFAADDSACQVNGLWLVRTADPARGITEVVVIAPDVPDGNVVRVYTSQEDAQKDPYWRSPEGYAWLKSRMSLADREKLRVMAQRGDPVKSTGKDSLRFFTRERMHFVPVPENFLERAYHDYVQTLLKDTDFRATSTRESTWKAVLSFAVDKTLLVADLPVRLLPSLRLLGRLGRGLSALGRNAPGAPTGTGSVAALTGRTKGTGKLTQGARDAWKLGSDESLGPLRIKVDPPEPPPIRLEHETLLGAPPTDGLSSLTQRMTELRLKERLSIAEKTELILLQEKLPEAKATLVKQHAHTIAENKEAWAHMMDRIPQVPGASTVAGMQYLAYLLSQQNGIGARITKMLESLAANGVDKAPITYRALHRRALELVGDPTLPVPVPVQGLSKVPGTKSLPAQGDAGASVSGHKSLPAQGSVLKSPFKPRGVFQEDAKRMSDGAPGGSPAKKYAWSSPEVSPRKASAGIPQSPNKLAKVPGGLTRQGKLPAPIAGFPYAEIPRSEWPDVLYHYTSRLNYDAINGKGGGAGFLNPSDRNPFGVITGGERPRLVYVTMLPPETGRKTLLPALFGRGKHQHHLEWKVACAIRLDPKQLPDGSKVIRYTDTDIFGIAVPGDGTIRLLDGNGANQVWTKPAPGGEIVPMEGLSG